MYLGCPLGRIRTIYTQSVPKVSEFSSYGW